MQRQQRIQRERLVEEFSKALTSFQGAQRQEKVKEKHSTVRANRPPSASYVSRLTHLTVMQQLFLLHTSYSFLIACH